MPVRLAIVGDIHHGRDFGTKKGTAALGLLGSFIEQVNTAGVDAMIDLGDRISDDPSNPQRDAELCGEVAHLLQRVRLPRHHVTGDHDLANLSIEANELALDAPLLSRSALVGDVRLVLWQPAVTRRSAQGKHLDKGDLGTLERLLAEDDRRTLLVTHVPLSGHAQTGNMYFECDPGHAAYVETDGIRRVISGAPCSVIGLAGHVHWNTLTTVDGTPHLTLQSLTESFTTGGKPAASTALITITDDLLTFNVAGLDPLQVTVPFPRVRRRWLRPRPPPAQRQHARPYVKILISVPIRSMTRSSDRHVFDDPPSRIREVIGGLQAYGVGTIGNYSHVSFSFGGTSRYRAIPGSGAMPSAGTMGEIHTEDEEIIAFVAPRDQLSEILSQLKNNHPYETPVIDVIELVRHEHDGLGTPRNPS